LTVIKTMILVGLFGLAMHFGYYWAAAAIVAVFVLGVYLAKRSGSRKALIVAHPSSKTDVD
jgi:UPF0716 family protein affecting phage T7 exclusion